MSSSRRTLSGRPSTLRSPLEGADPAGGGSQTSWPQGGSRLAVCACCYVGTPNTSQTSACQSRAEPADARATGTTSAERHVGQ